MMESKTTVKICTKCSLEKEATKEFFYADKNGKEGLSAWCKECFKKNSYNYYLNNKDQQHKQKRDKYNSDEEYRKNKALKQKEINDKNRSKRTIYHRSWVEENKEKIREYNKKRALQKSHNFTLSEWEYCKSYFENCCAYCGILEEQAKEDQGNYLHKEHVNHIGSNGLENCIPACKSCNSRKWKFSFEEWYTEDNPIYSKERYNRIQEWLRSFSE